MNGRSGLSLPLPPVVHHPDYSPPWPGNHTLPMAKYGQLYEALLAQGLAGPGNVFRPAMPARVTLALAHDRDYVDAFLDGTLDAASLARIGVTWSEALARRARRAVGGTLLAARLALEHGLALNCAGGGHHARRETGAGYCVFNDLAITALWLLRNSAIERVAIIDCDAHQGDGTASICGAEPGIFCLSLHGERIYPKTRIAGDLDVNFPEGTGDSDYLLGLEDALEKVFAGFRPQMVLYDAGVDIHREDRLGRFAVSREGIWQRELLVLKKSLANEVPLASVIGGGYNRAIAKLVELHCQVFKAAGLLWPQVSRKPLREPGW